MRFLLFPVAALITYGSLYPFKFSLGGVDPAAIAAFLNSWNAPSGRGDILGNVVLFIPFGFLGMLALPPRSNRAIRILSTVFTGFLLATALQVAQLYVPSRTPVLVDVVWNMVGLVMGALPAFPARIQALVAEQRLVSAKVVPVLLVGCWIGSLLVPFVPSIDLQLWKDSLKPLLLQPAFEVDAFVREFPAWLAAACLGALVVGERWLPAKFALVVLITLGLKIVIVKNDLDVTDVTAAAAAILAFGALIRYLPRREAVVALLLVVGHVYLGLGPFEARAGAPEFAWIPFQGSLTGSMFTNATVIAYKVFFYGALIWLLLRGGLGYVLAATIAVLAAGAVEIGQLYMGHGTPEITDPLLALLAAAVIAALTPMQMPAPATMAPATQTPGRPEHVNHLETRTTVEKHGGGWLGAGLRLTIGMAIIAYALHLLLRAPGIPYNVKELFRHGGTVFDLIFFALALISIGASVSIVAWRLAASRRPFLSFPGYAFLATVTTHLLLYLSVTRESLYDITGSTVFVNRVMEYKVLGDLGADAMQAIGLSIVQPVVNLIEPILRFAALFMPLSMTLALFGATLLQLERFPNIAGTQRVAFLAVRLLVYLASAAPLYLFCKFIAFDVSSTDNLNELIARDAVFGLGGGVYLYVLLAAIGLAGALLAWSIRRPTVGRVFVSALLAVLSLPVGWWLLKHGLEPEVRKYGLVYSGIDFLLGPDRKTQLPEMELMLRWFFVQGGLLFVIMFGAAIPPRRYYRTTGHVATRTKEVAAAP